MLRLTRHRRARLAALLAALGSATAARADDCTDAGLGELGAALVEHSCFHTTNGPFAEVVATPGTTPTAATPGIDPVHTHYTVAIDPAQPNVVTYTPVRAGAWAIFGDADVPHRLFDAAGTELPVRLTHAVAGCPALPVVRVFALAAFERYTLRLGPSAAARAATPVVVEKVSDFETRHGPDLDGDGHGALAGAIVTPCAPPPGYVPGVDDCDDADPAIHPGAAERCDGADNDCDGLGDEGACTVGGGGCATGGDPGALLAGLVAAAALAAAATRSRRPA